MIAAGLVGAGGVTGATGGGQMYVTAARRSCRIASAVNGVRGNAFDRGRA